MKRNVWVVAAVLAVVVSFWMIKKYQANEIKISQEEKGGVTTPSGETRTPSDGKTAAADSSGADISASTGPATENGVHVDVQGPASSTGAGQAPVSSSEGKTSKPEEQSPSSIKNETDQKKTSSATTTTSTSEPNGKSGTATPVQSPSAKTSVSPTVIVDNRPKATVPEMSCEEQWRQHVAVFKNGADLAYMTSLAVQRPLASDITTTHIETVTQSSTSSVVRDISFSSDHPSGILVLSSLNAAPSVTTSKQAFLSLCQAAGGRAVSSALFKLSHIKVIDIVDDNVKVGAGSFPVYRMKLEAGLLMNSKVTTAVAEVWMAKNKIGLVVKETIKLSPKTFADHGSMTISSQLAGSRKI